MVAVHWLETEVEIEKLFRSSFSTKKLSGWPQLVTVLWTFFLYMVTGGGGNDSLGLLRKKRTREININIKNEDTELSHNSTLPKFGGTQTCWASRPIISSQQD